MGRSARAAAAGIRDEAGTIWNHPERPRVRLPREPKGFEGDLAAFKLYGEVLLIDGIPTRPHPEFSGELRRFGADGSSWYRGHNWAPGRWKRAKTVTTEDGLRLDLRIESDGQIYCKTLGAWILEAFGQKRPRKSVCGYKDGNGMNCELSNLQWVRQNQHLIGRPRPNLMSRGELCHNSKLTNEAVRAMREEHHAKGTSAKEFAVRFDMTTTSIRAALKGETWPDVGGPIGYDLARTIATGNCSRAKLKLSDIVEIRRWIHAGVKDAEIARRKGVSRSTITSIRIGKSWKD